MVDSAVKVDAKLLKQVEKFVQENKYMFSSKKQVVNLAIIEFLNLRNSHKIRISDDSKKPKLSEGFLKEKSFTKSSKKGEKNG